MPKLVEDLISVSYIWIGPPSTLPDSSGVPGHDIGALTELHKGVSKDKEHQILFWCLDEFIPSYNYALADYLLGDNPIQICSIEHFLKECSENKELDAEELASDAHVVLLFLKLFIGVNIRHIPIADRVSCKELFSLFLLRTIGGYILDTNVSLDSSSTLPILSKPGSELSFMLPAFYLQTKFKNWIAHENASLPYDCFECWVLYSSGENEITRPMVKNFITFAGYIVENNLLIKAASLPHGVDSYLQKADLEELAHTLSEEGNSHWVIRSIIQNARGLPIMKTITEAIKITPSIKLTFFAPASAKIKIINVERDEEDSLKVLSPQLGVIKTYNNTHVAKPIDHPSKLAL